MKPYLTLRNSSMFTEERFKMVYKLIKQERTCRTQACFVSLFFNLLVCVSP